MPKCGFLFIAFVSGIHCCLYGEMQLRNASFDAQTLAANWELRCYGNSPAVSSDTENKVDGRQSIKIFSGQPSDSAIAQEIDVTPGKLYCLTGWIRTLDIEPFDSPVFATIIVQQSGGTGNIAYGQNHRGTCDWRKEVILFTGPESGKVRISLFFVGYGRGTGSVWFDDIRLALRNELSGTIKVQQKLLCQSRINPFQYGQFIEPFCDCGIGMWSEKISDQSFEGTVPFNKDFYFRQMKDYQYRFWYPTGAVNRGSYSLDTADPVNGSKSERIDVKNGELCVLGIAQDGIAVNKGETCQFSIYLRTNRLHAPVRVFLKSRGNLLSRAEFAPTSRWKKYRAELIPTANCTDATLLIEYTGPGTLWLDQASLMPADNVYGWRKDVFDAVKALKPGIIRWGGIAIEHVDWRNLIGDPEKRKPWIDPFWGGMHPPQAGIEEFVHFCKAMDTEPLICVRVTDSNASDAAAEVEYFNGSINTPMGKLRAQNGHPEPYNIIYWQVGNEQQGPEYIKKLAPFCQAMKKIDPKIKLLSSFPNPEVIRAAAPWLDYISPHHYADLTGSDGQFSRLSAWIQQYGGGKPIKIAITEWNTTAGDWGLPRASLWTLDNALTCSVYHNIMHHNADLVSIANRSDLINSLCAGCIQTDNKGLFKTPVYYAEYLYANKAGAYQLSSIITGDIMPYEISATISQDKSSVILFIVNSFRGQRNIAIDLSELPPVKENVSIWTLQDTQHAMQRDVVNSFENPERIKILETSARSSQNQFSCSITDLSVNVFRFELRQ